MIISIDGNIGSGKTTQLKLLKQAGYAVIEEDVQQWKDEGWLDAYYSDPSGNALGFQMRVLLAHLSRKIDDNNIIVERSPYSCNYLFGNLLYEDKILNELEYNLLNKYYTEFCWNPNKCIYIKTDPTICLDRINHRDRTSENQIPFNYLEKLDQKHEQYLVKQKPPFDVFIIDGNQRTDVVHQNILKILDF